MNVVNFSEAAKKKFHKLAERGYDPTVLKEFVHMQSIMSFNLKRSLLNDVRGTDYDVTANLDPK